MPSEYCPMCRTSANMNVTVMPRAIAGKDGKMKNIISETYHCEFCGCFVRSIDEEAIEKLIAVRNVEREGAASR